MTNEEIESQAKERAEKLEETQTLGVYDNDEDLAIDKSWNDGEVSGYEEGFIDGAKWGMEHAIQWHDLRKNPNDLPNDDRDVINERGMLVWCKNGVWYEGGPLMKIRTYPSHWCELPTYKRAKE